MRHEVKSLSPSLVESLGPGGNLQVRKSSSPQPVLGNSIPLNCGIGLSVRHGLQHLLDAVAEKTFDAGVLCRQKFRVRPRLTGGDGLAVQLLEIGNVRVILARDEYLLHAKVGLGEDAEFFSLRCAIKRMQQVQIVLLEQL